MGLFRFFNKQPKQVEEKVSDQVEVKSTSLEIPEEELIAILTAAIQSSFETTGKLIIRSYRRVEQKVPVWNRVARENLLNG